MKNENAVENTTKPMAYDALLGTGLVWYNGRYWLAENYDPDLYGGGWFASPIYETSEGLEVRPAGGNWCYKKNGAIVAEGLTNEQKLQVYGSWIKHLKWTCKIVEKFPKEVEKYNRQISYFDALRKACA